MDNRRQNYRHALSAADRIGVELDLPGRRPGLTGAVADLSVSGMRVRLADAEVYLPVEERLIARFALPGSEGPVTLSAAVAYTQTHNDARFCGIRFLPSTNPLADETRERLIWRYLLDEQRKDLRRRRQPEISPA